MADSAWQDPSVVDATAPNPFAAERGSYDTSFWQNDDNNNNNSNNDNNPNNSGFSHDGNAYGNSAYDNINNNMNNNINDVNNMNNNNNNINNNMNNKMNNKKNSDYYIGNSNNDNNYNNMNNNNNNNNNRKSTSINDGMNHSDLDWREENLRRKEKELEERKNKLNNLREEIETSDFRQDNWPSKCYPITFHSISQEIPPFARPHMRKMYSLVILTFFTFFWNAIAELIIYITKSGDSDSDILWATVYFFAGLFYAWKLWYRQIYYGLRDRKTIKWWSFFVFFIVHIGFACYMAIGIENGTGAAGFIRMFDVLQNNATAGLCNLIAAVLWTIVLLASVFLIKRSWNLYRQKGGLEQARNELTREAARQVVAHQTQNLV